MNTSKRAFAGAETEEPVAGAETNRHVAAERTRLRRRRLVVIALNIATVLVLLAGMAALLFQNGMAGLEWTMLAAFAITLPWTSIGLWNAIIGFALERRYGERASVQVTPALARIRDSEFVSGRIALVMPLRNEDPDASIARFRRVQEDLSRTAWLAHFDFHVLSDTDRPDIALREETLVALWRHAAPAVKIRYRRRDENPGYKAGNIAEFVSRSHDGYQFMLPLDADSTMGARTILRMVRVMEESPEIGMLQSLVTGLPSRTFFTRAFQFGMRHGMRSYTLGSAWWQGDCGPNWGHNVLIRMKPFHDHCMLPQLPGHGPLSGHILSHDQVEAVLMRRAGFEVRVIAEETESHEENPPSVVDFIRRDLRWCNGNMQYFRLVGLEKLKPMSRTQLYLAIQMYLAAPAWMAFILMGAILAASSDQLAGTSPALGLAFFALLVTLSIAPKVMGLAQVLGRDSAAKAYGGRLRVVAGGLAEIAVSMLISPVVAFSVTQFILGLPFGRRIGWDAQQRSRARLGWDEAARVLWPQTLAGMALALWLAAQAPWALAFGAPILLSLVFAIPIAVLTAWPPLGSWSRRVGLFDIPEDRATAPPASRSNPIPNVA